MYDPSKSHTYDPCKSHMYDPSKSHMYDSSRRTGWLMPQKSGEEHKEAAEDQTEGGRDKVCSVPVCEAISRW